MSTLHAQILRIIPALLGVSCEGKALPTCIPHLKWSELLITTASLLLLWGKRVQERLAWLPLRQGRIFLCDWEKDQNDNDDIIPVTTAMKLALTEHVCAMHYSNTYLLIYWYTYSVQGRYCYYLYFANDKTVAQREKATSVLKDKVWTFIYFALTVILCARDCFKCFT